MVVESISQMVFALGCLLQWIVRLSESRHHSGNPRLLSVRLDYREGELRHLEWVYVWVQRIVNFRMNLYEAIPKKKKKKKKNKK